MRLLHSPQVANLASVDSFRVVAEVVVGQLPQSFDFVEDHRQALQVGVERGGLGGHGGLRVD